MPRLPEYGELKEKKAFFQVEKDVCRPDQLDALWTEMEQLELEGRYVFRGVPQARYKMFSSAQRYWLEKDLSARGIGYKDFIKGLIEKTQSWNHGTIERFFFKFGITSDQTLAYLSYMQHFGVPTTLLDFSRKPFTGLFFMADGISHWGSDKEIDNFASLYMIDTNNEYFKLVMNMFKVDLDLKKLPENYAKELRKAPKDNAFESFFSEPVMMVFDMDPAMGAFNNTRIVNQKGNFCHSNSPDKPLEEHYAHTIQEYKKELMDTEEGKDIDWNIMPPKLGKCWNIHKALKPYILKRLREEENLTNAFVYPDNGQLASAAIQGVLEETP